MKEFTLHIADLAALSEAVHTFISEMDDSTVFAFTGEMGAGKTTFIKELCRQLGVEDDETNSPSFAIINEYRSASTAELMYHFDCYRLEDVREAEDIGAEDYFDSGALCFIEWPERIASLLPDDTVQVNIRVNDDDSRTVTVSNTPVADEPTR